MFIAATHLRIRGIGGWLRFLRRIVSIRKQVDAADGLVFVRIKGLRTLTGWESRDAMLAYRDNGPHREAMANLAKIGDAKSVNWEADDEPTWDDAIERLNGVPF